MEPWSVVAGGALLLLVAYLTWHFFTYGDNEGWTIYPFLGVIPNIIKHNSRIYEYVAELEENTSKMSIFGAFPGQKFVGTANPVHIQHVLKDNFANYPKGEGFHEVTEEFLGDGIFNVDGEHWKQQKKIASHEFSTNSLHRMMQVAFHGEIHNGLYPVLESAAISNQTLDMQDVFLRFTFDSIGRIGFGVNFGALSLGFPEVPFARSMDQVSRIITKRTMVAPAYWKLLRLFGWGFEGVLKREMQLINKFINSVLKRRRAELDAKRQKHSSELDASLEESSDLLSRMIALGERDHGELFGDSFLRDACLNFMLAGRDTTAVGITWLFWLLAHHPEAEQKILEEMKAVANKRDSSERGALFSFDELKQMTYLHAAVNEALRLYPPVPADMKYCAGDNVWPDGTKVKKGWRITYNIYSVGRMTRVWGPDAAAFRPERWITEDGQIKSESQFKFLAFNAGPRLCLGRDMAYLETKSVAASILRRYHLKLKPGFKVTYVPQITFLMQHGLPMTVHPRNEDFAPI